MRTPSVIENAGSCSPVPCPGPPDLRGRREQGVVEAALGKAKCARQLQAAYSRCNSSMIALA